MPGFLVSNMNYKKMISAVEAKPFFFETIPNEKYVIQRNVIKKYMDDKIFEENEEAIAILEGVIFNKIELVEREKINSFFEYVVVKYKKDGSSFCNDFRGPFCGAYYDKAKEKWIFYVDHIGDKPLFYYEEKGHFAVGTSVDYIVDVLKENHINYNMDKTSLYDMLTYGYMASGKGNNTFIDCIKRLMPGQVMSFDMLTNEVRVENYFILDNTPLDLNECSIKSIVDTIDEKFRRAIKREFDKDREYGLKSVASLSGGFDSRMTNWVAKRMGYDVISLTFAQNNSPDAIIPQKMSAYLDNEWIFKSLDDAKFLMDIDEIVGMNYGLAHYIGAAHGYSMNSKINFADLGMLHTGQLGDAVLGTISNAKDAYLEPHKIEKTVSTMLLDKVDQGNFQNYKNQEVFVFLTRGIGALASQIVHSNYTEMVSPFLDVDFLEYCFSIPVSLRDNHKIYFEWVKRKYPDAAKFKWEGNNSRITYPKLIQKLGMIKYKGRYKLERMLGIYSKRADLGSSMNPMDYWYRSNEDVRTYMDNYFNENINNPLFSNVEVEDMTRLYNSKRTSEKILVLTALAAVKKYFGN